MSQMIGWLQNIKISQKKSSEHKYRNAPTVKPFQKEPWLREHMSLMKCLWFQEYRWIQKLMWNYGLLTKTWVRKQKKNKTLMENSLLNCLQFSVYVILFHKLPRIYWRENIPLTNGE